MRSRNTKANSSTAAVGIVNDLENFDLAEAFRSQEFRDSIKEGWMCLVRIVCLERLKKDSIANVVITVYSDAQISLWFYRSISFFREGCDTGARVDGSTPVQLAYLDTCDS